MMHGAAIVVLHISPLAVIVLPQQDDWGTGHGARNTFVKRSKFVLMYTCGKGILCTERNR